jgi:cysteine synthase A
MNVSDGFTGAVGNTPLIRLRRLSDETGCEILGKAEFMNPGGSVKDRAAKWIVLDAERRGLLKAGGTVVEGTAGNTGIGLAHVCNARGYRCVIVMPDNQAAEKYQIIEALGAQLRRVPAVPYSNPNQYQKVAGRLAQELPGAIWANQFDNTANRDAHYESPFAHPRAPAARWRASPVTSSRSPARSESFSSILPAAPSTTTSRTAS